MDPAVEGTLEENDEIKIENVVAMFDSSSLKGISRNESKPNSE